MPATGPEPCAWCNDFGRVERIDAEGYHFAWAPQEIPKPSGARCPKCTAVDLGVGLDIVVGLIRKRSDRLIVILHDPHAGDERGQINVELGALAEVRRRIRLRM